jgi:type I restriction enzyme, S subunit
MRVVSGGTPSRASPEYFLGGTIPWMKTGEVKKCFVYETEEHIT